MKNPPLCLDIHGSDRGEQTVWADHGRLREREIEGNSYENHHDSQSSRVYNEQGGSQSDEMGT